MGTESKGLLNSLTALESSQLEDRVSLESTVLAGALEECLWQLEASRNYKKNKKHQRRWFCLLQKK